MISVGVAGASGYGGGELLRLLSGHPDFGVEKVWANTAVGQSIADLHPHLVAHADLMTEAFSPGSADELDLVFLAVPHGQSAAMAGSISGPRIVDLGADFRLREAAKWQQYYPGEHAGTWTYGMPELPGRRDEIAASRTVANPGCYATAITLAIAPFVAAKDLINSASLVAVAASGTTGAGRSPTVNLMASEVYTALRAYKVGGVHQHTPEIEQALGHGARLSFTPILAPMPRGILATVSAEITGEAETAMKLLHSAYGDEPFVTVLPAGQWPTTAMTLGSNSIVLQAAVDEHAGRLVVVAAIDNLVKGAAGQAIQNANLMFGRAEQTGLSVEGVGP